MERNTWRTSSRSGSNGQCVEVRDRGTQIDVRDSKAPAAGTLTFAPAAGPPSPPPSRPTAPARNP
ncbi:DUF397 domain-containing protein [Solwaraspora sp. WMMB762]|uniref:DUF397 domain-containing protein n=1 Tax=Solwaraspora sp. WMMB762 TaxID=3404120 RepID=UPI003B960AA0